MISVNSHSSICIKGSKVIWIDPFSVNEASHDADFIFITHSHYDHYSVADIDKVKNGSTKIIGPQDIPNSDYIMFPGDKLKLDGLFAEAIPAYNLDKNFHAKEKMWLGYLITMDNTSYYVCGDSDNTPEARNVKCNVLFVPCGGTYTMNYAEASSLANVICPDIAVPTHYGSIVGKASDGLNFSSLLNDKIKCNILIKSITHV